MIFLTSSLTFPYNTFKNTHLWHIGTVLPEGDVLYRHRIWMQQKLWPGIPFQAVFKIPFGNAAGKCPFYYDALKAQSRNRNARPSTERLCNTDASVLGHLQNPCGAISVSRENIWHGLKLFHNSNMEKTKPTQIPYHFPIIFLSILLYTIW